MLTVATILTSCKKEEVEPTVNPSPTTPSVQQQLNNGITPLELFQNGVSLNDIYCNDYAGGIIFYLDTVTGEGLVCSESNEGVNLPWDEEDLSMPYPHYNYLGNTDTSLWSGQQNTVNVALARPNSACAVAANYTSNGHSDWFLPSKNESKLLFDVLGVNGCNILPVSGPVYWTSSEESDWSAWRMINYSGAGLGYYNKNYNMGTIRPVRKF